MSHEMERFLFKIHHPRSIIDLKAIAYNLMVISNIELGDNRREIMKIVSC
jgi:hypothetical protein